MTTTEWKNGASLASIIDRMWRNPHDYWNIGTESLAGLNNPGWLALAAWDTAASFGPVDGRFKLYHPNGFTISDTIGRTVLEAEVSQSQSDQGCLLILGGAWRVFLKSSQIQIATAPIVHDPVALMIALQLIRDHLESVTLKPRDRREIELGQLAAIAKIDVRHFARLSSWYQSVVSHLQDSD